jgi:hypothetical protein
MGTQENDSFTQSLLFLSSGQFLSRIRSDNVERQPFSNLRIMESTRTIDVTSTDDEYVNDQAAPRVTKQCGNDVCHTNGIGYAVDVSALVEITSLGFHKATSIIHFAVLSHSFHPVAALHVPTFGQDSLHQILSQLT